MRTSRFSSLRRDLRGFTLVEIMVVVIIIGLILALAFPTILHARANAQNARFIADLRQARMAFESFTLQNGAYPADGMPGNIPAGMTVADLPGVHWSGTTSIGGNWDWDFQQFGVTAGISVYSPTVSPGQMAKIDSSIDDGNLSTGLFRSRSGGYIFVLED